MCILLALFCLALAQLVISQTAGLTPQNDTFNSDFRLNASQIEDADLSQALAQEFEVALNFERSNWATGSTLSDPFYQLPTNASSAPPGALLKVEFHTDTTNFTLPPNVALSRILYQSETINGTTVSASAYILWPYSPRQVSSDGGFAIVAWSHGTSGITRESAPSHIRNLWDSYEAPFILALQGYVVVAPDLAGFAIDRDASGQPIKVAYGLNPANANDIVYSVEAAQTAFLSLSKYFVVMGQSIGGGPAWAVATRQVSQPIEGYLGTIPLSPTPQLPYFDTNIAPFYQFAIAVAWGASGVYPDFNLSEVLSPVGIQRLQLLEETSGAVSAFYSLFNNASLVHSGVNDLPLFQAYERLANVVGLPISGPMLVLQGSADPDIFSNTTEASFNTTCTAHPDSQIELSVYEGVGHAPILFAAQQQWLAWIADRFENKSVRAGCFNNTVQSVLPYENYAPGTN